MIHTPVQNISQTIKNFSSTSYFISHYMFVHDKFSLGSVVGFRGGMLRFQCLPLKDKFPGEWFRWNRNVCESGEWCILDDNAPACSCVFVRQFLAKWRVPVFEHQPYSPVLTPTATSGFIQNLKAVLKEEFFCGYEHNLTEYDNSSQQHFGKWIWKAAFQALYDRFRECVMQGGMHVKS